MSKIRFAPLALALTLAATSNAWADAGFSWNGSTVCGGNTFATCAAVTVNVVDGANGAATITMTVTNLSGTNGTYGGTVFTQLGLDNLPLTVTNPKTSVVQYGSLISVTDQNNNAVSGWQLGTNGLSGAGIDPAVIGTDTQNGVNGALGSPNTYTFVFTVTGWNDSYLTNAGFAIHGQAGPNTCSTKLVISSTGTGNTPSTSPDATCDFSTVPEPISMALVGTGLASMGGMGFIRRRKKNNDIG